MHITLISLCQKRAIKRTRAVLDRYAVRSGPGTWMTPITEEALGEIQRGLRQTASRNTAVACYRNTGARTMSLIWIVGRRQGFGARGAMPVGRRLRELNNKPGADWVASVSLIAQVAGRAHDIGKASAHFQSKLMSATVGNGGVVMKDKTRHEWTSLKVFQCLRNNRFQWNQAWEHVRKDPKRHQLTVGNPVRNIEEAVDFAVLTHHRMLAPVDVAGGVAAEACEHTNRKGGVGNDDSLFSVAGNMDGHLLGELAHQMGRITTRGGMGEWKAADWWGVTVIARAALILADHEVSARVFSDVPTGQQEFNDSLLKANTCKTNEGDASILNQPLEWHLTQVGRQAGQWVRRLAAPDLAGLSAMTRERIDQASGEGRFQWQDVAAAHLKRQRSAGVGPTLVFNMAGTGSGKTRMNLRAIHALTEPDTPMRVAAGFNLRTLTLQTHDAFGEQAGVSSDEMACVIGDRLAKDVHQINTDENEEKVEDLEYGVIAGEVVRPEWLTEMSERYPHLDALIGAPILVSTMDYIVNAGDPRKQAHHGHALLRVASSDLILDEVDSYDPKSLVAVLRVVMLAGVFGRNVVASSATLAQPLAEAVFESYQQGVKIWQTLNNKAMGAHVAFIDDLTQPASHTPENLSAFAKVYDSHLRKFTESVGERPAYRVAKILGVGETDCNAKRATIHKTVIEYVRKFHADHCWEYDPKRLPGKMVSIGLVRVANVRECVILAKRLAEKPNIFVCGYHAADIRLRRAMKEKKLDRLLRRTPQTGSDDDSGNQNLRDDSGFMDFVKKCPGNDVVFIVVATPVEEIGRDHDFDWAILEPSSAHALVQAGGRVNRHRLVEVATPNIGILDINFKEAFRQVGELRGKAVFVHPGHENEYPGGLYTINGAGGEPILAHTMTQLLGESCGTSFRLDASLCFGKSGQQCEFAKMDDAAVIATLKEPLRKMLLEETYGQTWMTQTFYKKYTLRDREEKLHLRARLGGAGMEIDEITWKLESRGKARADVGASGIKVETDNNDWWLCPTIDEIIAYADAHDIDKNAGMEMELAGVDKKQVRCHARLGAYRVPKSLACGSK